MLGFSCMRKILTVLVAVLVISGGVQCAQRSEPASIDRNIQSTDLRSPNGSFFEGEWLVVYMAAPCQICGVLDPIIEKLSTIKDFKDLKFAKVTLYPLDHNNQLPTVYHIKNGYMRQYEGPVNLHDMVQFIKRNIAWFAAKSLEDGPFDPRKPPKESFLKDFSNEVFNLVRGTLALAALILLFAWLIDLCSTNRPRRRDFREVRDTEPVDQVDLEIPDELVDDETAASQKLSAEDSSKTKDKSSKSCLDVPLAKDAPTTETDQKSRQIFHDDLPTTSSILKKRKVCLNPFCSSDSLTNNNNNNNHLGSVQLGVVRESAEISPVLHTTAEVPKIQETKIEKSNVTLSEISRKKNKNRSKSHRLAMRDNKMRICKIDEIDIDKPRSHEIVTLESKLPSKKEIIIVQPIVEDTLVLNPLVDKNEDNQNSKATSKLESKC